MDINFEVFKIDERKRKAINIFFIEI